MDSQEELYFSGWLWEENGKIKEGRRSEKSTEDRKHIETWEKFGIGERKRGVAEKKKGILRVGILRFVYGSEVNLCENFSTFWLVSEGHHTSLVSGTTVSP